MAQRDINADLCYQIIGPGDQPDPSNVIIATYSIPVAGADGMDLITWRRGETSPSRQRISGTVIPDTITGSPVSIVQGVEGDTLARIVTPGRMSAQSGQVNVLMEQGPTVDGPWVIYDPATVMTYTPAGTTWCLQETTTSPSGTVRVDVTGPMTVVGQTASASPPSLLGRSFEKTATGNAMAHAPANPVGAAVGKVVMLMFGIRTYNVAMTVSGTEGWNVDFKCTGGTNGPGLVRAWKRLDGTNDAFTLATSQNVQSVCFGWAYDTPEDPILGEMIIGDGNPDSPAVGFGGPRTCAVVSVFAQSQNAFAQTDGIPGYTDFRAEYSNTNGNGSSRLTACERIVTNTSENPDPWPVFSSSAHVITTFAIKGQ